MHVPTTPLANGPHPSADAVVQACQLSYGINGRTLYHSLDLSLQPGSVYKLQGKNSRSTMVLLGLLMGFTTPTAGRCLVFGEDAHNLSLETRNRIGLLNTSDRTYEVMTIGQVGKFFQKCCTTWQQTVYSRLAARAGKSQSTKVGNLNESQRLLVALAVIIARNPDLIVVDDSFQTLDRAHTQAFIEELRHFMQGNNKTILLTGALTSAAMDLVDTLCFVDRTQALQMNYAELPSSIQANVNQTAPTFASLKGQISPLLYRQAGISPVMRQA